MNLLNTKPKVHRELFYWDADGKHAKEEYTLQNLKDYFAVSFSPLEVTIQGSFTTVEDLEIMRQRCLEAMPPMLASEEKNLLALVDKYGLEIILYSMDMTSVEDIPSMEEIEKNIPEAISFYNKLVEQMEFYSK